MCVGFFLRRRSCVFFLSSCSALGRRLLSLFLVLLLCLFLRRLRFSAACPAAGYPLGVPQPFWLQLPVLLLQWSFVVGFAVSWVRRLVFYLVSCPSSSACGWCCLPCRRLPLGVAAFSDAVCLTFCCAGGVGWAATFCYQCFSCTVWLAGVHWVLHPVSGGSHRGCVSSLDDSVVVLLTLLASRSLFCCSVVSSYGSRLLWGLCGSLLVFPCLRVRALLACGVYGASALRSLQSRLPFAVSPPFHVSVVLHLLLRWDGLVPGMWPLLLLLCVGLLWGLCCARSVALAYGRSLSCSCFSLGFFLGVCSDLGW